MKVIVFCTLLGTALAVPNVTAVHVEYPGTCTEYPNWINTRDHDLTGSFMFVVDSTDDSTINGLPLQPYSVPWGSDTRNFLGVDFIASRHFAKAYYRCFDGVPAVGTSNPSQNLTIARDMNNAHILVDAPQTKTYVPEIYYLEGEDGKRLDGVYLGAKNKTTWGFSYEQASCGSDGTANQAFLQAKLLGLPVDEANPPTAGYPPEWQGFLKLVSW